MRWTIPNILTVARLLAALGIALVYLVAFRPLADWLALALFGAAALTDYLDGYIARKYNQISAFGRMLDPIADKAIVVIALAVILGLSGLNALILIPVTLILFREVFVSGLREFLGAKAGLLQVTKLAKWKTATQMFAIFALFLTGIMQAEMESLYYQLEPYIAEQILAGQVDDPLGYARSASRFELATNIGLILIWLAALLTVMTGVDYFIKSLPFLTDEEEK